MWTAVGGGFFVALVLGGVVAAMFGFVPGTPAFGVTFVLTWLIATSLFWPKETVLVERIADEPVTVAPAQSRGGFWSAFNATLVLYLAVVLVIAAWRAIV